MVGWPGLWVSFTRHPLFVLGLIAAVVGVVGWISGWQYGHGLTTVALLVMVIGSRDYMFTIPYAQGFVSVYYSRKLLAGGDDEEALRFAANGAKWFGRLAKHRPEHTWRHAVALDHLWSLLNGAGRHEEALAAAEPAVAAWRIAAADDAKWSRSLADALNRVFVSRAALDTTDGLLEPTLEAIELRRENIAEEERRLAPDLHCLGIARRRLDQWSEALPTAEELVAVRRRMLARTPGDQELILGLANALYDLGRTLCFTDRGDDAAWAFREATELYQAEVSDVGGANTCNHTARVLEALELPDDALDAYRAAVAIRRRAGGRDDKLADDLTATATLLLRLDRDDEALPVAAEAVDVCRHLGEPARLAGVLHLLGAIYEHTGDLHLALAAGEEALAIVEELATEDHDQLHHLAMSLDDHASLLRQMGRNDEARDAAAKAAEVRREHDLSGEPGHDHAIDDREP
jgi:tetratricopeptide (TPR) repeat protein